MRRLWPLFDAHALSLNRFGNSGTLKRLALVDGKVEYLGTGPGRPEIVSTAPCYEDGLVQQQLAPEHDLAPC